MTNRAHQTLLFLLLIVLFAPGLVLAQPLPLHKVTVQLSWKYQFQFAPFITAYEKGFYRDAGLEVEIHEGGPGINAVDQVVNDNADFGVFSSALVVEYAKGKPVVALAALMQHSPVAVITHNRPDISSVHDLAGKYIAASRDTRDEIRAFLESSGLSKNQYKIFDKTKLGIANLEDGHVDAVSAYISNEGYYIKGKENEYQLFSPRSAGIDLFGNILFTSKRQIEDNRRHVEAFRAATLKGLEYALNHRQEVTELILERYNTQNKTAEHLLFEADKIAELNRPDIIEPGYMSAGRWRHVADVYADQGKVAQDLDLGDFIYDPPPRVDTSWLYWLLAGCILVLVIVSGFLWQSRRFNLRLKDEIRERQQAEKSLRASEIRFKELFDNNPDPCWVIDKDMFVECNQAAVNILGYPNKQALSRCHPSDVSPETQPDGRPSREKAHEMITTALQKGTHRFEWTHQRQNGECFPVEVTLAKFEMNGHDYLYCVWRDITKRKRAEEESSQLQKQLLQSQKLEMIGQLTGGIAHDFNNILASIVGYTDLTLEDVSDLPEEVILNLTEIRKAGMRAKELVVKMLAFARGSEEEAELLDPRSIVEEVLQMLTPALPASLQLRSHTETEVPKIYIPEVELHQVITNLIINARDAMTDMGHIDIGLRLAEQLDSVCAACQEQIKGDYVELYIQDDGAGINPEVLTKIFDPFFTTKEIGKGSGMGLSMVMGIIHKTNGHILVNSTPGKGTRFQLLFPVAASAQIITLDHAENAAASSNSSR